jgi:hypothetical protein
VNFRQERLYQHERGRARWCLAARPQIARRHAKDARSRRSIASGTNRPCEVARLLNHSSPSAAVSTHHIISIPTHTVYILSSLLVASRSCLCFPNDPAITTTLNKIPINTRRKIASTRRRCSSTSAVCTSLPLQQYLQSMEVIGSTSDGLAMPTAEAHVEEHVSTILY